MRQARISPGPARADEPADALRLRAAYGERLESLREDLALAERHGDAGRAAAAEQAIAELEDEVVAALQRPDPDGSEVERLRKAVGTACALRSAASSATTRR